MTRDDLVVMTINKITAVGKEWVRRSNIGEDRSLQENQLFILCDVQDALPYVDSDSFQSIVHLLNMIKT